VLPLKFLNNLIFQKDMPSEMMHKSISNKISQNKLAFKQKLFLSKQKTSEHPRRAIC